MHNIDSDSSHTTLTHDGMYAPTPLAIIFMNVNVLYNLLWEYKQGHSFLSYIINICSYIRMHYYHLLTSIYLYNIVSS